MLFFEDPILKHQAICWRLHGACRWPTSSSVAWVHVNTRTQVIRGRSTRDLKTTFQLMTTRWRHYICMTGY